MITRISKWVAILIARKAEREKDLDYIRYGIEVILSIGSKIIIFFLFAKFLGIFLEMFSIIISFALLRAITGGVHMSAYSRCLGTSLTLFVIPAYLLQDYALLIQPIYIGIITFMSALIIILLYVPVSSTNRPIPKEKHNFFKRTSSLYLSIWLLISILLSFHGDIYKKIFFFTSLGVLIQNFTLTPFGYKMLNSIDQFFQFKKERLEVGKNETYI